MTATLTAPVATTTEITLSFGGEMMNLREAGNSALLSFLDTICNSLWHEGERAAIRQYDISKFEKEASVALAAITSELERRGLKEADCQRCDSFTLTSIKTGLCYDCTKAHTPTPTPTLEPTTETEIKWRSLEAAPSSTPSTPSTETETSPSTSTEEQPISFCRTCGKEIYGWMVIDETSKHYCHECSTEIILGDAEIDPLEALVMPFLTDELHKFGLEVMDFGTGRGKRASNRISDAIELYAEGRVELPLCPGDPYLVASRSKEGEFHQVYLGENERSCSCADYSFYSQENLNGLCAHVLAATISDHMERLIALSGQEEVA